MIRDQHHIQMCGTMITTLFNERYNGKSHNMKYNGYKYIYNTK